MFEAILAETSEIAISGNSATVHFTNSGRVGTPVMAKLKPNPASPIHTI